MINVGEQLVSSYLRQYPKLRLHPKRIYTLLNLKVKLTLLD